MSSTRLKLLLIRGLSHSGTTMLDLALGVHPQIIGLGEAMRILATPKPGTSIAGPVNCVVPGALKGAVLVLRSRRSARC